MSERLNVRELSNPDDWPMTQCPQCHGWQPDPDGFGVLCCQFPDCDYCDHSSITGDVCDLCGKEFTPDEVKP